MTPWQLRDLVEARTVRVPPARWELTPQGARAVGRFTLEPEPEPAACRPATALEAAPARLAFHAGRAGSAPHARASRALLDAATAAGHLRAFLEACGPYNGVLAVSAARRSRLQEARELLDGIVADVEADLVRAEDARRRLEP